MKELFVKFISSPGRETYLAVRQALITSEGYDPYSSDLDRVNQLVGEGRLDLLRQQLSESMSNLLLSPNTHLAMAFLASNEGDKKSADMESFFASALCQGILATGEGTETSPYIVTRTSDEHDVVRYLQKEFSAQSLVHKGEQHLDRVLCEDGTEYWFDISDAYNKQQWIAAVQKNTVSS